jgi:hypothetical protein
MNARLRLWLTLYQFAAGLCDTSTGLLLIFAPAWTLRLMGMAAVPSPIVFAGYIGVFVFAVGLTYIWTVSRWPLSTANGLRWQTQWQITALFRSLVALFLASQVAMGAMEGRWIAVAFTDGAFAAIQWIGLRRGWIRHAE